MQKRGGAYTLIETILLIGFVVVSMFAVYSWARSMAKEDASKVISGLASSLQCADIKIAASCDSDTVIVNNTGLHTIKKLLVRWIDTSQNAGQSFSDVAVKPYECSSSTTYAECLSITYPDLVVGREVTPIVEINGKLYMCKEKGITIKCS